MNIRYLFTFFILFLLSLVGFAQNGRALKKTSGKGDVLTLSDGKYEESFHRDSLERVGSVNINRYTRKIQSLEPSNDKPVISQDQSRFLSVDPITKKFAELSPYQYASNRPIEGIDLDGLEFIPGTYNYKNALYISNLTLPKDKQLTQQELERRGNAMDEADRTGKLIGFGISLDLFTGGKISQFLFYHELFSAFEHNKAKTPEGIAAQNARSWNALANSGLTFGLGKVIREGLIAAKEAIPLFRGTTVGFAGNRSLQILGVTPTSTDPGVSTILATEAEAYGEGILYITNTSKFSSVGVTSNVLEKVESEVAVNVLPSEFPGYTTGSITPKQARGILKEMGIEIPNVIKKADVDRILRETPRLNPDQINEFLKKAQKLSTPTK